IQAELERIKHYIQDWNAVDIYTDGSMKKYNDTYIKIGIGGIIINLMTQEQVEFKGRCEGFPSSTRAELIAILTALSLLNTKTRATIYTDSQSAIHTIGSKTTQKKRIVKSTNLITTTLIMD